MTYEHGEPGAVLTLMQEEDERRRKMWRVVCEDAGPICWYQLARELEDGKEVLSEETFEHSKIGRASAEKLCAELNARLAAKE